MCVPIANGTGSTLLTDQTIETLVEDFEFLDDWEDRYRYVIELGKALPEFADADRCAELKVHGCASQVWLKVTTKIRNQDTVLVFSGDSDAHIVRGLIAILLMICSGRTPEEILATNIDAVLHRIGLDEHLTPQRSNGLQAMTQRIRGIAIKMAAQSAGVT